MKRASLHQGDASSSPPAFKRPRRLSEPPQISAPPPAPGQWGPPASAGKQQQQRQEQQLQEQPKESGAGLWLVVGLGNPGANYERTRHNVGFMVIDELAKAHGIDCRKLERSAAVGKGVIENQQVLLAKPVTFMNNSGEAVSALAKFYKVPTQRILVIADDLDLPHAALRMRPKGGHGGHNGLRSIMDRMGNTQDFPRIKLGIGRPAGPIPIVTWVLQDFTKREMEDMQVTVQQCCDAVRDVMSMGLERALSIARGKEAPPPPPAATKKASPASAPASSPAAVAAQQQQQQQQLSVLARP